MNNPQTMNDLDGIYGAGGGNYLKAKDLTPDTRPVLWIKRAVVETKTFRQEEGPKSSIVLDFFEQPNEPLSSKRWTLNKTQAQAIQAIYGSYENWPFNGVRIWLSSTRFRDETKPTIAIYPDPFPMKPEERAAAEQYLRQEQAQAQQAPTHSGPQNAAPQMQQAPQVGFTPAGSFAPPTGNNDPTRNW